MGRYWRRPAGWVPTPEAVVLTREPFVSLSCVYVRICHKFKDVGNEPGDIDELPGTVEDGENAGVCVHGVARWAR